MKLEETTSCSLSVCSITLDLDFSLMRGSRNSGSHLLPSSQALLGRTCLIEWANLSQLSNVLLTKDGLIYCLLITFLLLKRRFEVTIIYIYHKRSKEIFLNPFHIFP